MALITPGIHMSAEPENHVPVNPGDVIADKYRVERVLGRGGMGVVVAATHLHLDQRVALKFIIPGAVGQDTLAVERFMREARAAGRLKSEHVAKVFDVGMLRPGAPYIVMEYLEGEDLSAVIEAQGALAPEVAADYVMQACEAMAEAHSLGIVHRDLKPQNLFLTRGVGGRPLVKVLDFGVSKVRTPGAMDKALTSTASIMGSPMYMAPEQMRSARSADARSDIWALGVVLYTLLTGEAPFEAETMTELALKVVQDAHPPVSLRRPNVAPGLASVVDRCLEKNPADRFPDVSDLAIALMDFAPPASRILAEHTRSILRRNTDRPPGVSSGSLEPGRMSRQPSSPSSPGGRVAREPSSPSSPGGQALPERTIVSPGSPMGSTSAGWAQPSKGNRTRGVVGGVAVAAFLVGALVVVLRAKHAADPEPTPARMVISSPATIGADPGASPPAPAPPAAPVPTAALVPAAAVVAAPAAVDAGAVPAMPSVVPATPPKPTPKPAPAAPAKDAARRPAPSSHDDDIPALR